MWEKFIKPNISRSNVVKDSDCRILCIDPQFDQVRLGATVRCLFGWIPSLSSSTQQQVTGEFLPVRSFGQYFEYPHGMCFSIYRHRGCRAERANPRPKVCILNDQANKKWFLNCCPSRFFWMDRFVELGFFSRSFFLLETCATLFIPSRGSCFAAWVWLAGRNVIVIHYSVCRRLRSRLLLSFAFGTDPSRATTCFWASIFFRAVESCAAFELAAVGADLIFGEKLWWFD